MVGSVVGITLGREVGLGLGLLLSNELGLENVGVGLVLGITLDASVGGDTLGIVVVQVSQVTGHTLFPSPSHTLFL